MPIADRTAQITWMGSVVKGEGTITSGSGALGELPVTYASRVGRSEGKTSPEELIAAAHAACFSMALSNELTQSGHEPEQLDVSAVVTLDRVGDAPTVTSSALTVTGRVPGIDAAALEAAAQGAGANCPISRLLADGTAEITVAATLAG